MEANMAELRSEITKLQIEINMLRQMLGSLTRAEQANVDQLQAQAHPDTFGFVGNLMPAEQQTLQQLEQMKQIGSQLKQQIDRLSSVLGTNTTPGPDRGGDMSADNLNDPMQRTT